MSDGDLRALQGDLKAGSFSEKERALLELAQVLTVEPHASPAAVKEATSAGWTNEQVADAIFIVSLFNMMTRIADAFALPPDASHRYKPDGELPMLRCE